MMRFISVLVGIVELIYMTIVALCVFIMMGYLLIDKGLDKLLGEEAKPIGTV